MDFICVPDRNPRKYGPYVSNSTRQETSSMGRRGIEDTSPDHLLNSTPFKNNASQVSGLSSVRRPRADTMPSRTTIFPYTASTAIDNSGASSTTVATPSGSDLYVGGGSSNNLAMSSNDARRRRSGSVTLLSSSDSNIPRQDYGNALFTSGFPPYHMMEENATNTVQSTLASLGLDDTLDSTNPNRYLSSSTSSVSTQSSAQQQQQQQQMNQNQQQGQQLHRHRAYTVSTRHSSASNDRLGDMLPMGFHPFSPQTRSSVLQRPRAVSVGVMDDPHFDDERSSFSPFEMTSLQSAGQTSMEPSSAAQQQHQQQHQQQQQQRHLPPSRLGQQVLSDTQQSLRISRSSGNLMDIPGGKYSVTDQFDDSGIFEDASMEDLTHQNEANAVPTVSSSTSVLLDSPSSAPAQVSSRALWLGNISPSLNVNDLIQQFSLYGNVESARILSDKECAFVNFTNVESAVAAKNDLETRLGSKLGGSLVRIGFGKADVTVAMALTNEAGPNAQGPTRALWVGNIPANMNLAILQAIFQAFGPIESIRILSHKNCGFINFEHQEDAVRARKNLQNKEILGPGSGTVRIGFAKNPSVDDINNAEPGFVSISSQSQSVPPTHYQTMYQQQQQYPLPQHHFHQNQNFTQQSQSIYQQHPRPQVYMPHTYTASNTAPQHDTFGNIPSATPMSASTSSIDNNNSSKSTNNNRSLSTDTYQATQWATAMMMTTMMINASGKKPTTQPSLYSAIATERQFIMQQLCRSTDTTLLQQGDRAPVSYFSAIPPVPELNSERILEPLRLRDMRKRLDSGQGIQDVEMIAQECMNEIVELCSDYIGNTVVQKLFEHCTESTKQIMLERIAPFLAAIGVHKNGTWAAQKIIDYANTPGQVDTIRQHIAPYVPLLLLDQFGNYVVQCCLRLGAKHNQYIFDAIVDKCWEIGQGRFGARAARAILENSVVTKEQQVYCAAAIVQNAVLLTTNANGMLLLVWLLDTSEFSGRYRVLYPRLLPYLSQLCTHKLGSMTVYKIIQQQEEPDTSRQLLNALTTDPHLLDDVLRDQVHGVALLQKIMALPHINNNNNNNEEQQRTNLVQLIRASLDRLHVHQVQAYRKLIEELEMKPTKTGGDLQHDDDDGTTTGPQQECNSPLTKSSSSSHSTKSQPPHQLPSATDTLVEDEMPIDMVSWMKNPQAVAMVANMYAAAMTSAATIHQQQQQQQQQHQHQHQITPPTKAPELSQFNYILKSLLTSTEPPMPSTSSSPSLATSDSSSSTNKTSSSFTTHSDAPTAN